MHVNAQRPTGIRTPAVLFSVGALAFGLDNAAGGPDVGMIASLLIVRLPSWGPGGA